MSALKAFVEAFFKAFPQDVSALEMRDERVQVALSGDLMQHFGRSNLMLTFTPHDAEGELVAFGSRVFDELQAFLARRGALTVCHLPAGRVAPLPALINGQAITQAPLSSPQRFYEFNYHAAFLSDERHEQVLSFMLDAEGQPAPEAARWLERFQGEEVLLPFDLSAFPSELSAAAEALAVGEAERSALPFERESDRRLAKVADRLTDFYEEQIKEALYKRRRGLSEAEALDALIAERHDLRDELARKLADEQRNHQQRIQLRLVSRAIVEVPGAWHGVRLESKQAARTLNYWENRHTGVAGLPGCERCGDRPLAYALCASDHLVCSGCLGHCAACERDLCAAELAPCSQCGQSGCRGCLRDCAGGHSVCNTHLRACERCGMAVCGDCARHCPACEALD
jgi:hypothetical protein